MRSVVYRKDIVLKIDLKYISPLMAICPSFRRHRGCESNGLMVEELKGVYLLLLFSFSITLDAAGSQLPIINFSLQHLFYNKLVAEGDQCNAPS